MVFKDVDNDTNCASDVNSPDGVYLGGVKVHHIRTKKEVFH